MKNLLMAAIAIAISGCFLLTAQQVAPSSGTMPVATTNALVHKYCEVCHDDAHLNGGMSLEHFDAAHANPSIAAMLLSKLTNGLPLARVSAANTDPAAAAAIDTEMKNSAIHAAGLPAPDSATARAWVMALSAEADRATEWTVNQVQTPASQGQVVTASVVREVAAANDPARMDIYRLTLTCRPDTREGKLQVAWAPGAPKNGRAMSVSVDGNSLYTDVDLAYGIGVNAGPGAALLYATRDNFGIAKFPIPVPKQTLAIGNLTPDKTVVFPFEGLTQADRESLSKCFTRKSE
jgi:hypothetical protein